MHESATPTSNTDATEDEPLAYSVPKAARLMDMGERKLWGLVHSGEIPSFKVGSSRRVSRQALLTYINRQERAA